MPVPMMNILNGGCHADNTVDLQEFMIMPIGAENFAHGLQMGAEVYHALHGLIRERRWHPVSEMRGGFAPDLRDAEEALALICEAVERRDIRWGQKW